MKPKKHKKTNSNSNELVPLVEPSILSAHFRVLLTSQVSTRARRSASHYTLRAGEHYRDYSRSADRANGRSGRRDGADKMRACALSM